MNVVATGSTGFEVAYVDEDLVRCRESLAACWTLGFEKLRPVRPVRTSRPAFSRRRVPSAGRAASPCSPEAFLWGPAAIFPRAAFSDHLIVGVAVRDDCEISDAVWAVISPLLSAPGRARGYSPVACVRCAWR